MSGAAIPGAPRKPHQYSHAEKMRFYLQLKTEGEARGYNPSWAAVTYREKFKDWPAWSWRELPGIPAGVEVLNYITSRLIAYRNRRLAEGDEPDNPAA
jgi:hypothetical protein